MAELDESQKKAFDFAADISKQLITLSTGILAFTITFVKDSNGKENNYKVILIISWILYFLSIACGILTSMALTGNLDPIPNKKTGEKPNPALTITSTNVTIWSKRQIFLFLAGIVLSSIYGANSLFTEKTNDKKNSQIIITHIINPAAKTTVFVDTITTNLRQP
jgi:hypothetical protein